MGIFITRNNEQFGPFTKEQILAGLNENRFSHTDLAWQEGMTNWQPLSTFFPEAFGTPAFIPPPQPNLAYPETSGLAIASLVTGIGVLILGPLSGLASIITGHLAYGQIRASMGRLCGKGMALTGLILGYASVAVTMIAIAGFFLAIAIPNFQRAKKRQIATRTLEDLRLLDSATDQYAIETNKTTGTPVTKEDLRHYLKPETTLYKTFADPMGHKYGPFVVDEIPKVPLETYDALSDVADAEFWSPYH